MFRSLMVPIDGSLFAEQALPWALALARRAGAQLQLVHVHAPLSEWYPEAFDASARTLSLHLLAQQQVYLEQLLRRLRSVSEVPVAATVLKGEDVAVTLRATAASTNADLVVMTTHGRGPLQRLWLGSVADALVRELSMPLLLLRPSPAAVDLTQEPVVKHILLPLDGTALAEQILRPALALGRLLDADFTLLWVVRPVRPSVSHLGGAAFSERVEELLQEVQKGQAKLCQQAEAYLDGVAGRLRAESLRVQTRMVVEAQPAQAILEEIATTGIDLVALETHGRKGLSRLLLGSVADKVLRGGTVPMLVHRPVYE